MNTSLSSSPVSHRTISTQTSNSENPDSSTSSPSSNSSSKTPSLPPSSIDSLYEKYSSMNKKELNIKLFIENNNSIDKAYCLRRLTDLGIQNENVFDLEEVRMNIRVNEQLLKIGEEIVNNEEKEENKPLYEEIGRFYLSLNNLFMKYKKEGPEEEIQDEGKEEEAENEEEEEEDEGEIMEKEELEGMIGYFNNAEEKYDNTQFNSEESYNEIIFKEKEFKKKHYVIVIDEDGDYSADESDFEADIESEV